MGKAKRGEFVTFTTGKRKGSPFFTKSKEHAKDVLQDIVEQDISKHVSPTPKYGLKQMIHPTRGKGYLIRRK